MRAGWMNVRTRLEPASVTWLWWCSALLAHYDDRGHWRIASIVSASVVAAVVGMFCTRSAIAMLCVAVLQLGALWHLLPGVDNHWAFAGFVDLALAAATLGWIVRKLVTTRRIGPLDDDWYATAAPVLRLLVLAMYGFAVFHKLNTGFLAPETSCAVYFYERITVTPLVPLSKDTFGGLRGDSIVAGVIALEAAIPILLFGRRTWFLGIAAGVVFHLATGMIMRHYPSIMLALYWVFVPTAVQRAWLATVDRWIRRATKGAIGYVGIVVLVALVLSFLYFAVDRLGAKAPLSYAGLRAWNVFVIAGGVVAVVAFVRVGGAVAHPPGRFRTRAWGLYALVVAFVVNCLSPYLGLKTTSSINMWSNLVVTGKESNHVLVPTGALRVFDYTSDVVVVLSSNDTKLKALARRETEVSWFMFRQAVQRAVRTAKRADRKLTVTYVRGGKLVRVRDAAADPALMERGTALERKIVKVKSADGKKPDACSW